MLENKKPSPFDINRFIVFKERGWSFKIVVLVLLLVIIVFTAYRVAYMLIDDQFPFPK